MAVPPTGRDVHPAFETEFSDEPRVPKPLPQRDRSRPAIVASIVIALIVIALMVLL